MDTLKNAHRQLKKAKGIAKPGDGSHDRACGKNSVHNEICLRRGKADKSRAQKLNDFLCFFMKPVFQTGWRKRDA